MKPRSVVLAVLLLCWVVLVKATPASAATCNGGELMGTGQLIVPPGVSCSLSNITLDGGITVQGNGSLSIDRVLVKGSVSAPQPGGISITGSFVRGISVQGTATGAGGNFTICGNSVAGGISVNHITVPINVCNNSVCAEFTATYNTGNLSVSNNTFFGAGTVAYNTNLTQFSNNHFGGLLRLTGNTPIASTPQGNTSNDAEARTLLCPEQLPFHGE